MLHSKFVMATSLNAFLLYRPYWGGVLTAVGVAMLTTDYARYHIVFSDAVGNLELGTVAQIFYWETQVIQLASYLYSCCALFFSPFRNGLLPDPRPSVPFTP